MKNKHTITNTRWLREGCPGNLVQMCSYTSGHSGCLVSVIPSLDIGVPGGFISISAFIFSRSSISLNSRSRRSRSRASRSRLSRSSSSSSLKGQGQGHACIIHAGNYKVHGVSLGVPYSCFTQVALTVL